MSHTTEKKAETREEHDTASRIQNIIAGLRSLTEENPVAIATVVFTAENAISLTMVVERLAEIAAEIASHQVALVDAVHGMAEAYAGTRELTELQWQFHQDPAMQAAYSAEVQRAAWLQRQTPEGKALTASLQAEQEAGFDAKKAGIQQARVTIHAQRAFESLAKNIDPESGLTLGVGPAMAPRGGKNHA